MGTTRILGGLQADSFTGAMYEHSPFGKVWYVDVTNGSDGNSGEAPDQAYASIGAAISAAVATRGDTVIIAPGTYTITSALVPKAHMTFRAAVVNPQAPSVSIRGNIARLVTVDVDGSRFIGIEFRGTGTTVTDLVALADTTAITGGVTFEDCVFHGADTGSLSHLRTTGIWATDASNAVNGLVVRRCLFRDLGKTCLDIGIAGAAYAKIEDNVFAIDTAGGIGIRLDDTTAFGTGKGYTIRRNEFLGASATTSSNIGIVLVAATINTTGAGVIADNRFTFHATAPITQGKLSMAIAENYTGNGGGGTLVDPIV